MKFLKKHETTITLIVILITILIVSYLSIQRANIYKTRQAETEKDEIIEVDISESEELNTDIKITIESIEITESTPDCNTEKVEYIEKIEIDHDGEVIEVTIDESQQDSEIEIEENCDEDEVISEALYSASELKVLGVLSWGGYRWTWYSEQVLPGGGLDIPGRCLDENGYVCDEDGYICLASGSLSKGTVVPTPLGKDGKIYDYCETPGVLDVYVGW